MCRGRSTDWKSKDFVGVGMAIEEGGREIKERRVKKRRRGWAQRRFERRRHSHKMEIIRERGKRFSG
jgi:hypothetical protein